MTLLAVIAAAYVGVAQRPPVWRFVNAPVRQASYDHGYMYAFTFASVTYVADVTLDSLPKGREAAICGRSGWHNAIFVREDGTLRFTCFDYAGRKSGDVYSKKPIVTGRQYRVAGVVDCSHGNETRLRLYVDGELQGEIVAFEGAPFVYPWKVWVGQVGETGGKPNLPMDGTVRSFWYFHQPLTKEEIDAL